MRQSTDPSIVALGDNLKYVRDRRGFTFIQMEKISGYDRECLALVEYKEQDIKYFTAIKLAKALNISFPRLFSRELRQMDQAELNQHPFQSDDYLAVFTVNMKRQIQRKQMKQTEVAEISEIQPETISRILTGKYRNPLISKLAAMATATDTNLNDMFTRK